MDLNSQKLCKCIQKPKRGNEDTFLAPSLMY